MKLGLLPINRAPLDDARRRASMDPLLREVVSDLVLVSIGFVLVVLAIIGLVQGLLLG